MNRPPIKKDCHECNGEGTIKEWTHDECYPEKCPTCYGKKEVYNYLTPEQYVAWMREHGEPEYEMIDSLMWVLNPDIMCDWCPCDYETAIEPENSFTYIIVAMDGQPKPADDWRIE